MTPKQIQNTLTAVISTLNVIEVKGKANMNHLLGTIMVLEDLSQKVVEKDDCGIKLESVDYVEEAPKDEEH